MFILLPFDEIVLFDLKSRISEFLGISSEVAVQRRVGAALQREKYSQSNSELEVGSQMLTVNFCKIMLPD